METITIFTSGISLGDPGLAAIGVQVLDAKGEVLKEVSEPIGNATDTFAEYQAVMRALHVVREHFGEKTNEMSFELKLSSEHVQRQLCAKSQINEPGLVPHFIEIHNMRVSSFPNLIFVQVGREANKEADRLVSEALDM